MAIDFTPIARPWLVHRARRTDSWATCADDLQKRMLRMLLGKAVATDFGRRNAFHDMLRSADPYSAYASTVAPVQYEDIRDDVLRMVQGEKDVLWPGRCRNFAQSSGTSGGRSKYIPITADSLRINHYPGSSDIVAHYLRLNPQSRMFAGKGLILGGSFANSLETEHPDAEVGDLSATLIKKTPALANLFRVPSKRTALMADWEEKLPRLAAESAACDVTNISGVPSWMLMVLKKVMETAGTSYLADVWPNLEVFFHGGISFKPYRQQYEQICGPKMHFMETYNASEGFFATQNDPADPGMLLLMDAGVFFEFIPLKDPDRILPVWEISEGEVYELVISAPNGLWRYRIGDTVKVTSTAPVKIVIAGRTKTFINAFGEELMEHNAEAAMAEACRRTDARVRNYTAGPVFATGGQRGRHEWIVEWEREPESVAEFARILDLELQKVNTDYEAKRAHTIFLDPPTVVTARPGLFSEWLASSGNCKLGGQRKVPRLSNDRQILDALLELNGQ